MAARCTAARLACWAALALLLQECCAVGTVHHTLDDALEHAGLNPVTKRPSFQTGQVRAAVSSNGCLRNRFAGTLEGCFGLPDDPHPTTDPVLQLGTVTFPANVSKTFPVRGTELVFIPLEGGVKVTNGLGQEMDASAKEALWLSAGSGSQVQVASTTGVASKGLLVLYDSPLQHKEEAPHFQHYMTATLGHVQVPCRTGSASLTLFSGPMHGGHGPARTFTAALLGLATFTPGTVAQLHVPAPKTGIVHVISGRGRLGGHPPGGHGRLGRWASAGDTVRLGHPTRFGGVKHEKAHEHHRFAKAGTGFMDDLWVYAPADGEELVLAVVGGLPAQHGDEVAVLEAVSMPAEADLQGWLNAAETGRWKEAAGHFHSPLVHGHLGADEVSMDTLDAIAAEAYDPHDPETTPPPHLAEEFSSPHDEL